MGEAKVAEGRMACTAPLAQALGGKRASDCVVLQPADCPQGILAIEVE
ncbi:MAG: hypothetical protein KBH07_02540 [Flavobacteriales bacterium]|nr:hypothetical protein [Flavobacteriales bacterium]MBP9079674.1 hypothetical protein [Flavobacteriales bacterium]